MTRAPIGQGEQGVGVRAGSRAAHGTGDAVSAVPASIPDAEIIDGIVALLRNWPDDGRPPLTVAREWAKQLGFIETREISKRCSACGTARPDYSYMAITPAGRAILHFAERTP